MGWPEFKANRIEVARESWISGAGFYGVTCPLTVSAAAAPEPATWALMGVGFGGLAFAGYRARKSAAVGA